MSTFIRYILVNTYVYIYTAYIYTQHMWFLNVYLSS